MHRRSPTRTFAGIGSGLALLAAGLTYYYLKVRLWVAVLVGINLATLVLYAGDKLAAKRGWSRVPEKVLHLAALLGGSPGALLSQQLLRHKTRKQPFVAVFWGIVGLQVVLVFIWYGVRQ